MKTKNKDYRSSRRAIAQIAALIALCAIIAGVWMAFNKLRSLWIEQCEITDVNRQVEVESGTLIKADDIREMFGLRNGANLATIDFASKREEALKKYPAIKDIRISRRLPDGVAISVMERVPSARLGVSGAKKDGGRVCDDEGVVFKLRRGAELLPIIRETVENGTQTGRRIEGRSLAALCVLQISREAQFLNLNILEIDTAKPDYLLVTLANYSAVKLRWEGMETTTPAASLECSALRDQLTCVVQTISTNLSGATRVWNATQPGIVTADSNRPN